MRDTIRKMIDALNARALEAIKARKPKRPAIEARLQDAVQGEFDKQKARLLKLLGNPPNPANVPPEFWQEVGAEMAAKLKPIMQDVYLAYAMQTLGESGGVGVDWSLVNRRAIEWSGQYSYRLVTGITDTTRANIDKALTSFFETPGATRADLEAMLEGDFGPVRASMIAVTETTRAASEGETALAQELRAAGVEMTAIWYTDNDELVCPICSPLQDREADGYQDGRPFWDSEGEQIGPPPAHVNCRCMVGYVLP